MAVLIITRGLPASGKTTFARQWTAAWREHRVRVNRDDLRAMIDDGEFVKDVTEPRIIMAENALIAGFLDEGINVICDDTNLPQATVDLWRDLAKDRGAEFVIMDLTGVPLEECIERNSRRERKVPEDVIRDLYEKWVKA